MCIVYSLDPIRDVAMDVSFVTYQITDRANATVEVQIPGPDVDRDKRN